MNNRNALTYLQYDITLLLNVCNKVRLQLQYK